MITNRYRSTVLNQTLIDQVSFVQGNEFTRVTGLGVGNLTSLLFCNNQVMVWPLTTGASITDSMVVSGYVYFNEIPGNSGYYSVRYRPTSVGAWQLSLDYAAGTQSVITVCEVYPPAQVDTSLNVSFL